MSPIPTTLLFCIGVAIAAGGCRSDPKPPPLASPAAYEVRRSSLGSSPLQGLSALATGPDGRLWAVAERQGLVAPLELAEGFRKATKRKITAEKAAECYLQFRNWDFKNTWLKTIKGRN